MKFDSDRERSPVYKPTAKRSGAFRECHFELVSCSALAVFHLTFALVIREGLCQTRLLIKYKVSFFVVLYFILFSKHFHGCAWLSKDESLLVLFSCGEHAGIKTRDETQRIKCGFAKYTTKIAKYTTNFFEYTTKIARKPYFIH